MTERRIATGSLAVGGLAALLAVFSVPGSGFGADAPGRYAMSPTEGGFVRLDTQTGAMALCNRKEGAWICADMPENADSGRQRIDALEKENQKLKDDIKRLEETFAETPGAGPDGPKSFTMPEEKDVDKAFDYVESMIKKFRERMKKLEEKEGAQGTPL